ncbi:thiol reductant ABC exporter CydD subunit [Saccharomonospora amisosensis]|uniref:Thiol reductant ABC exporter CydD subunit n=1 Tax=Saccharomonospora amisosensis TaxID=1128677 RepID=A0A7X5UQ00_9PSEU|nr:thiol reductant ABC exporter subunit CydD [Saccharomonospora amisosensis]NIJ12035.1 thiol reductant ABC exporter CydD subunit [Saccharomonospora amisosensis]
MRVVDPRLLRHAPSARRFLVLAGLLAALSVAVTIAQAVLFAHIVVAAFLEGSGVATLLPALLAFGGLALVRGALTWALDSGGNLAAQRVARELRARVLAHVVRTTPGDVPTAEVATATTEGTSALEPYFARFLPRLWLAVLAPTAILVWVAVHDLPSALVMLVTLPLIPVFGVLIGKLTQARTRARWQALARMSAHFLDVVSGLTTLRVHRRGVAQARGIADTTQAYRRETMGVLRVGFLSAFVLELAATVGTALIAAEIGIRLVAGGLTLQPALMVLLLAPELYGPLRAVASDFHASADGVTAASRLLDLLRRRPAVAVPEPARPPRFGVVRFEDVVAAYPGRGTVLDGVNFELRPGERVALVGASGAGKTTLLALLLRFADPVAGRITVDGVDLREFDPREWRRLLTWLPQRPRLRPGAVRDAVLCDGGPRIAERLGVGDLLERSVGEDGAGLSSGEVSRLALARALGRDVSLTLLDEPTAHLDPASAAVVAATLRELPAHRTVLAATHDADLLGVADRVVELRDGRARQPQRAVTS